MHPRTAAEERETKAKQAKREQQQNVWVALAEAQLRAGGAEVVVAEKNLKVYATPCIPTIQRQSAGGGIQTGRATQGRKMLEDKGINVVVCCEFRLKCNRADVERPLESLGLDVQRLDLVTDKWVQNCFHYKKLLPITDEYLFRYVVLFI